MHHQSYFRDAVRWAVWAGFCVILTSAAILFGGVIDNQWQWIAAGTGLPSLLCLTVLGERPRSKFPIDIVVLALLAVWMVAQLAPLPPAIVRILSPHRWADLDRARQATGVDRTAWMQISVAPFASFERLLKVLPAMAAFVAAREMGGWWRGRRMWLVAVPVLVAATVEGFIGMLQYSPGVRITGTYVNRNHYAGLLEMAFPLAVAGAFGAWLASQQRRNREPLPMSTSVIVAISLGCAATMLFGIAVSQSRMGFLATLVAAAAMTAVWILARKRAGDGGSRKLWVLAVAVPVGLVLLFATGPLLLRFAAVPIGTADGRFQITKETLRLIAAYPLTGCGLGAYEHGLYPFRVSLPDMELDFAHNDYLQALSELGMGGGALLLVLGALLIKRIYSIATDIRSRNFSLGLGLWGSFVAIGLHSLVDFNMYIPANALAFAWIAGIAASPALTGEEIAREKTERRLESSTTGSQLKSQAWRRKFAILSFSRPSASRFSSTT